MFVTTINGGKGNKVKYVVLKESYVAKGGKRSNRIVKTFGRLDALTKDDPEAFEKLKARYNAGSSEKKAVTARTRMSEVASLIALKDGGLGCKPALLNYGYYALRAVWNEALRLDSKLRYLQKQAKAECDINALASFLVFQKALGLGSMGSSFLDKDNFLGEPAADATLDDCCEVFDFLKNNKESILKHLNKRLDARLGADRAAMVVYDAGNACFEGEPTSEEGGEDSSEEDSCRHKDFFERALELANALAAAGELDAACRDADGDWDFSCFPAAFWDCVADEKTDFPRMRGPFMEHRTDLPEVSIVMVFDRHGFPMDFEVCDGNASPFKTTRSSIQSMVDKYGVKEAIVAADGRLSSMSTLKMLQDLKLDFAASQKAAQLPQALEEQIFDLSNYSPISHEHPEIGSFLVVRNWVKQSRGSTAPCTLVVIYSEKRRARQEAILDAWVRVVERKAAAGVKLKGRETNWAALAKTNDAADQEILGVDEEALAKRRKLCGFSAVVVSAAKDELGPHNAFAKEQETQQAEKSSPSPAPLPPPAIDKKARYPFSVAFRHAEIENSLRIMKTNLGLLPMDVRNSDHIRAQALVNFLALVLLRLVQDKLEKRGTPLSINTICKALCDAKVAAIYSGSQQKYFYVPVSERPSLREHNPRASTEDLLKLLKSREIEPADYGDVVLQACGLSEVPAICSRAELARSLGTRFASDADAVPAFIRAVDALSAGAQPAEH